MDKIQNNHSTSKHSQGDNAPMETNAASRVSRKRARSSLQHSTSNSSLNTQSKDPINKRNVRKVSPDTGGRGEAGSSSSQINNRSFFEFVNLVEQGMDNFNLPPTVDVFSNMISDLKIEKKNAPELPAKLCYQTRATVLSDRRSETTLELLSQCKLLDNEAYKKFNEKDCNYLNSLGQGIQYLNHQGLLTEECVESISAHAYPLEMAQGLATLFRCNLEEYAGDLLESSHPHILGVTLQVIQQAHLLTEIEPFLDLIIKSDQPNACLYLFLILGNNEDIKHLLLSEGLLKQVMHCGHLSTLTTGMRLLAIDNVVTKNVITLFLEQPNDDACADLGKALIFLGKTQRLTPTVTQLIYNRPVEQQKDMAVLLAYMQQKELLTHDIICNLSEHQQPKNMGDGLVFLSQVGLMHKPYITYLQESEFPNKTADGLVRLAKRGLLHNEDYVQFLCKTSELPRMLSGFDCLDMNNSQVTEYLDIVLHAKKPNETIMGILELTLNNILRPKGAQRLADHLSPQALAQAFIFLKEKKPGNLLLKKPWPDYMQESLFPLEVAKTIWELSEKGVLTEANLEHFLSQKNNKPFNSEQEFIALMGTIVLLCKEMIQTNNLENEVAAAKQKYGIPVGRTSKDSLSSYEITLFTVLMHLHHNKMFNPKEIKDKEVFSQLLQIEESTLQDVSGIFCLLSKYKILTYEFVGLVLNHVQTKHAASLLLQKINTAAAQHLQGGVEASQFISQIVKNFTVSEFDVKNL